MPSLVWGSPLSMTTLFAAEEAIAPFQYPRPAGVAVPEYPDRTSSAGRRVLSLVAAAGPDLQC